MQTLSRLALAAAALGACQTTPEPNIDPLDRVLDFRTLVRAGDYDAARALMSEDPRRWWGEREGEGSPWTIGTPGRWSDWDEEMHSTSKEVEWTVGRDTVSLLVSELNDYYRLLERGPQLVRYTYFLDRQGRLDGYVIASEGARNPGRTDEYLAWAAEREPDELEYLRPGGEIDPTGDRAARTRAQINRWRATVDLPPIEAAPPTP